MAGQRVKVQIAGFIGREGQIMINFTYCFEMVGQGFKEEAADFIGGFWERQLIINNKL